MADIKTRQHVKDIKVLDKASVAGERMKNAFIRSKDTTQNLMDDGQVSPSEYAEDQIKYAAEDIAHDTGRAVKRQTDKAVEKGREAFREHRKEKRLERQEKKVEERVRRYEERSATRNTAQTAERTSARAKNTTIKTAALTQIGNVGGEPYWSWYGFSHRVEWCVSSDFCGAFLRGFLLCTLMTVLFRLCLERTFYDLRLALLSEQIPVISGFLNFTQIQKSKGDHDNEENLSG